MTKEHTKRRLAELQHAERSFRAESIRALNSADKRNADARADAIAADIQRLLGGGKA
jgi:hypothetical protein